MQELKSNDLPQRRIFGGLALGKLTEDPLLYRKIMFSDDANCWMHGYANKKNCRFYSEGQPKALEKLPKHSEKVIIGPYFFKDAALLAGFNKTVPHSTQYT